MVKVSVIIPVYNGENHLEQCLDSICGQTLKNIEIICVDDGSTDSSYEILKQYQKKDDRIQIYQQDHQHAGVARNLGINYANGEYLAFWDCDDFFNLQALEKLYNKAKSLDADICVCGGNRYIETKRKSYPFTSYLNVKKVPKEDPFNRYTNKDHYLDFTTAVVWNKLFMNEFIEDLSLNFQPLRNGNDIYFTISALGLADRITTLNEQLVTYRMNQGGNLTDSHDKDPLSPIQAWIDTAERLEKQDGFGERSFANRAIGNMVGLLSNLKDGGTFNQAVKILQEYGLKKMYILPKEDDYYYNAWDSECVQHLYHDTPEQFAVFLANSRYISQLNITADLENIKENLSAKERQVQTLKKENDKYKQENEKQERKISELELQENKEVKENTKLTKEISRIRNSWTFKIGRAITWIPSKLKKIITDGGKS